MITKAQIAKGLARDNVLAIPSFENGIGRRDVYG
jgi:hypothetical protein